LAATLISLSGCYTDAAFANHWSTGCYFDEAYRKRIADAGADWRTGKPPLIVNSLWKKILAAGPSDLLDDSAGSMWRESAVELMCIADEASSGMGFPDPKKPCLLTDYLFSQHVSLALTNTADLKIPLSLCKAVPTSEVCVQPKTRTPQIGCTLRSLTHNLALLPAQGEIQTKWLFVPRTDKEENEPFNILLVPFPFRIEGRAFYAEPQSLNGPTRFFGVRQNWLNPPDVPDLLNGLKDLVKSAEREVRRVHGLVLPETALDAANVVDIATELAKATDLELFITGTLGSVPAPFNVISDNNVFKCVFANHAPLNIWPQAKHHRWRLDGEQIRRYHLGDALDPSLTWWEKTGLGKRECAFYVFRSGASLAALVCEDLARIDPVQPALRAIGPNLVIVLLMDGPQLERRWPGRYATVLSDDPGSAVLTLTSIGMVNRAAMPGAQEHREIALWKEPGGFAQQLSLPRGCHGLLLTLSTSWEENFTLDSRSDRKTSRRLSLGGVRPVRAVNRLPWLDEGP
jgi:hypothetical protein